MNDVKQPKKVTMEVAVQWRCDLGPVAWQSPPGFNSDCNLLDRQPRDTRAAGKAVTTDFPPGSAPPMWIGAPRTTSPARSPIMDRTS